MLRASDGILDMLPIATYTASSRYLELDGTEAARSLLSEVLETGKPVRDAERMIERSNGSRMIVSVNIDPLLDAKGNVVGAVNCFLDITERKSMDVALEQSRLRALEREQLLAATYEHAAIGISEVAPDGRFLRVNEATCTIAGMTREQHLQTKLFDRTHPDDADADREAFHKQVEGKLEFYSIEKRLKRLDGRIVWLSVRSSPVRGDDGHLLYIVRVVQDITERKASERRQKLREDLVLRPRAVLTLAMVFHELTTNAAKYGALSAPGGVIDIRWQAVRGKDGRTMLQIEWIEQGGPPVVAPKRRGFGSKLIEGSVAAEHGGSARLTYDPAGLCCEILMPMEAATVDFDGEPQGVD